LQARIQAEKIPGTKTLINWHQNKRNFQKLITSLSSLSTTLQKRSRT
jgi:hypothetical protein